MISQQIAREHVLLALTEIDRTSVPAARQSVDYDLVHQGKRYPPKFTLGIAARYATGNELGSEEIGGPETIAFLHSLGFEVVRRERPTATGPAADVKSVGIVFERLVPDDNVRGLCTEILAETIEQAHAAGEARWQITFQSDLIRINGGRVLMMDVRGRDVFLGVDSRVLDANAKARLAETSSAQEPYTLLPYGECFRVPHAVLPSVWSSVKPAFQRWVAEALLTGRRCAWSRSHSPAVVEYLSGIVGRRLPQPVYGHEDEASPPELRKVYWVNQGEDFEPQLATGHVYGSLEKSAPGSVSIKDLQAGDVLVHYGVGAIRAVSRVRERPSEWHPPDAPTGGLQRVVVESWVLPTPVDPGPVFASEAAQLAAEPEGKQGPFDGATLKQGHLWAFTEDGLALLRAASPEQASWPAWAASTRSRYWMFHANPDRYDVRGAVKALRELTWTVRQHRSEIHVGDTVFLWEAGPRRGVVALARVLSEPAVLPMNPDEASFRRAGLDFDGSEPVVRLAIERVANPVLGQDELRAEPVFSNLTAFFSAQRTNSALTPEQGVLLRRWLEHGRPRRVVKVAPGAKGECWNECLAGEYVCVGWDETGDLRKYEDWSTFRSAFSSTCELGKRKGHVVRKAQELWALRKLRPGDKIVANRGVSQVLGVGTVREPGYVWNEQRASYRHTVTVDWDTSMAGDIPAQKQWASTTVDRVPADIIALTLPELVDEVPTFTPSGKSATAAPEERKGSIAPGAESPFESLRRSFQSHKPRLWFPAELIAHYILALQAKRFVILTGVSGTGKTQLALVLAKHFRQRVRRSHAANPPPNAVSRRVSPYMGRYRRIFLPAELTAELQMEGIQGTGSATIEVYYPGGKAELKCHRDVRSSASSVHQLSLKGDILEWIRSLAIGTEMFLEVLETSHQGRDNLRISLPGVRDELTLVDNYEVIAVRPDWHDARGLLGFYNPLTRRYLVTPFLRLLMRASEEAERAKEEERPPMPFFAIFDEMNLARVEQYFSDFLSAMESGERVALHDDQQLESGELDDEEAESAAPVPRSVNIPANLFFTGTVNVDETTFMFSPKVLDRAFVIEFNDVNLVDYGTPGDDPEGSSPLDLVNWHGFEAFSPVSTDDWDALAANDPGQIRDTLVAVHQILQHENRHFGFRVANEIGRFISLAARQSADPVRGALAALDLALVSKILPKLHGTQQEMEDTLQKLFAFAVGPTKPSAQEAWTVTDGELTTAGDDRSLEPRFPRTSLKLWRMLRRVRAQGFTSFIE